MIERLHERLIDWMDARYYAATSQPVAEWWGGRIMAAADRHQIWFGRAPRVTNG